LRKRLIGGCARLYSKEPPSRQPSAPAAIGEDSIWNAKRNASPSENGFWASFRVRRLSGDWPQQSGTIAARTMDSETKTVVTFESTAFNMAEPKDYFINPCCFGDDVAMWLIGELRKQGLTTDEKPGQEDFGWYLNFKVTETSHTLVIGHRPAGETEAGTWIAWLERRCGFLGSLVGGRERGIQPAAIEAIDRVLSNSSLIRDVRWQSRRDLDKN
jgi:hypothetical protein